MSKYIKCDNCEGTGQTMGFRLYPTGHTEIIEDCENCGGSGEVEEE